MTLANLSIVILTYNRYGFLERLLDFYQSYSLKYPIIILDSSSDVITSERLNQLLANSLVVHKKFDSAIFPSFKIDQGLEEVKTPFAVLCAEDDFLIPDGLAASVDFLVNYPDYSCAHGRYVNHKLQNGRKFIWSSLYKDAISIVRDEALDRFVQFLSGNGSGIPLYAVHRTDDLKFIWQKTAQYIDGHGFIETFSISCSLLAGKLKILPVFYSSRSRAWISSGVSGRKSPGLSDPSFKGPICARCSVRSRAPMIFIISRICRFNPSCSVIL